MKTKIKMMKRIMALLLCLCMCFSNAEGLILFAAEADIAESAATGIDSEETEGSNSGNNFALMAENAAVPIADTSAWNATSARPNLFYTLSGTFGGGVPQKNQIHVYAKEGDTICLGTSMYNSAINLEGTGIVSGSGKPTNGVDTTANTSWRMKDEGSIDIVVTDLSGEKKAIDIRKGEAGYIGTPAVEKLAKTMTSPNGNTSADGTTTYTPYKYYVEQAGVYTFEFRSYVGSGNGKEMNNKTTQWVDPAEQMVGTLKDGKINYTWTAGGFVAAWDISVFDENNEKKTGRVYTDYLSLQTVDNLKEEYYFLTNDSYIYKMRFNDVSPYTISFFANAKGITDSANGSILYKSVKSTSNDIKFLNYGVNFTYPSTKDTDVDKNFKIFFEKPNEDLKGILYENAVVPDPVSNVQFQSSGSIYEGKGGYFKFDVEEATSATIRLDFAGINKKTGGNYKPIDISDRVLPYTTCTFFWDGKDGDGNPIKAGDYSLDDLGCTVTAKTGEIHVPIVDMECANEGITFTRVSDLYTKKGELITGDIYEKTKNLIYYDDTAIYYGEKAASTGLSESTIKDSAGKTSFFGSGATTAEDYSGNKYYPFFNALKGNNGGEWNAYQSDYAKETKIRIGDHSHITNAVDYTKSYSEQSKMIDYLNSDKYPVGKSKGSGSGQTTTDYGLANYYTFIPSQSVALKSTDEITIKSSDDIFNLKGRVFYDIGSNKGVYRPQQDGDHLLANVKLNLYKLTTDSKIQTDKTYITLSGTGANRKTALVTGDVMPTGEVYELISTAATLLDGSYTFTGLEYDPVNGTKYVYEVVKPSQSYTLTSQNQKGGNLGDNTAEYGPYILYDYDHAATGTEVQVLTVGGSGIEITKGTVTAIDVGYSYTDIGHSLKIKKTWKSSEDEIIDRRPNDVAFQIDYVADGTAYTSEVRALSASISWENTYEYLEQFISKGTPIDDWFVAAEYYIYDNKIFRHKYQYSIVNKIYEEFVGDDSYYVLSEGKITDLNGDGQSDWNDVLSISEDDWKEALPAGTVPSDGEVVSPYNSVIDRDVRTDVTEITVTNAAKPATIEVLKYTGALTDEHYLPGATFRIYEGEQDVVQNAVKEYDEALAAYNNDLGNEELKSKFQEKQKALIGMQVDSKATRVNGRVAFAGLDPNKYYTVRERFAPSGYRIVEEYVEVKPASSIEEGYKFDNNNYCLVSIGNIEASSDLSVAKIIKGRSWIESDHFTFDIKLEESDIAISTSDVQLYTDKGDDLDNLKKKFLENIKTKNQIAIDNDSDTVDGETKTAGNILTSGIQKDGETEKAALNSVEFPAAGTYTFTLEEEDFTTAEEGKLTKSPRVYTVTIEVTRTLDSSHIEDDEVTLDNSHLEASISNVTFQDRNDDGTLSSSNTYMSNRLDFTNIYTVEAEQKTQYEIKKVLTGERGWNGETFTFRVYGEDETTQNALINGNLVLNFDNSSIVDDVENSAGEKTGEKHITLSEANQNIMLNELDFHEIEFPVDDTGVEENVVYSLIIEEVPPADIEADGDGYYIKNGLRYSKDKYKLVITLENAAEAMPALATSVDPETDGIPDKITLDLYQNSKLICSCWVQREMDDGGNVTTKSSHGKNHTISLENIYSTTALWVPAVTKKVEGRDWVYNEDFSFNIKCTSSNASNVTITGPKLTIAANDRAALKDGNSFSGNFNEVVFSASGEYEFEISEDSATGFADNSPIKVWVKAEDQGDGTLKLSYKESESAEYSKEEPKIEFINAYTDNPASFGLSIKKTLSGRDWNEDDKFIFTITPDDETKEAIKEGILEIPATLSINDDGSYTVEVPREKVIDGAVTKSLGNITVNKFNPSGTNIYTFTVKEQPVAGNGITYPEAVTLKITVSRQIDDDENVPTGDLNLEFALNDEELSNKDSEGHETPVEEVVLPFTNTYKAAEKTVDIPEFKKVLEGRELKENEFDFTLQIAGDEDGYEYDGIETSQNDADGSISFASEVNENATLTFTKPGTYKVTVKEVIPTVTEKGMVYSTRVKTITYEVTDNKKGNLETTESIDESVDGTGVSVVAIKVPEDTTFTNKYVGYKLVYAGNEITGSVTGTPTDTNVYLKGEKTELQKGITHNELVPSGAEAAVPVLFLGWTETENKVIYGSSDDAPVVLDSEFEFTQDRIEKANTDHEVTVYAAWGYDTNNNGVADVYEAYLEPQVKKTVTGQTTPSDETFTFNMEQVKDSAAPDVLKDEEVITITIEAAAETTTRTETGNFDELVFTEAGTYTFEIAETDSGETGYTYDDSTWTLTVVVDEVEDGNGKLEVKSKTYKKSGETSGNEDAAEFENRYTPKPTTYAPQAEKQLTGDPIPALNWKTFEFTISADADNPDGAILPDPATATVPGEGFAEFGDITFEKAGTYNFTITETKGSDSGYEYDDSVWTLTVEVTDNAGVLEVTSHTYKKETVAGEDTGENDDNAIFTNQYKVNPASYTPKAEKILSGQTPVKNYEFTFELVPKADYEGKVKNAAAALTTNPITVTHAGAGEVVFPTLTFTQAGTYEFTIKEVKPAPVPTGYTFDEREWTLKVKVTDNESTLEISAEYEIDSTVAGDDETNSDAAYFRNEYVPNSTTYAPEVQKELTGDPIPDEKKTFTFSIENADVNDGAELPTDTTISVIGDASEKTAKFGNITFTKAGTYNFTITENKGDDAGYRYDDSEWTLTVKVEDKDGNLEVTSHTYAKAGATESRTDVAVFENSYTVTPVDYQIGVTKVLTGITVPDGYSQEFQFELTNTTSEAADKFEMPSNTTLTIDFADPSGAYSDADERTGEFEAIKFKQAGTYMFTVTETDGKRDGYTYSDDVYTVKIVVADNDSKLEVESVSYAVGIESKDEIDFTNNYHPLSITYKPKVTKTIDGVTVGPHAFTFTLEAEGTNPPGAKLPDTTELTITTILGNNAKASGTFDAITFSEAGTYQFIITENATGKLFAYDDSIWVLTVVTEDVGGTLKVVSSTYQKKNTEVSNTESADFKNEYTPENATYNAQVEKQISGDPTPEDDQKVFTFTIEEVESNPAGVVLPTNATTVVEDKGNATFDAITFKKAGTYNFTISEKQETYTGYTFDKSTWNLKVEVVDHDGKLEVESHTYTKNGDSEDAGNQDKAIFENVYKVEPVDFEAKAEKVLTGETPIRDITYTFDLASTEDYSDTVVKGDASPLAETDTITVERTGAGDVTFPALTFKRAGTYTFTIKEQKPDSVPEGYTYDDRTWTLTVVVKDNKSQLEIADTDVTYKASSPDDLDPSSNDGKAHFHNVYEPTPVDKNIVIAKEIEGDKTPNDKTFSFDITAAPGNKDGGADLEDKKIVTITGADQTSQKITFKKAGTYKFTVAETKGAENGYTYDGKQWTVTVKVSDKGGHLAVDSITYRQDGAVSDSTDARAVFTNEYHVTPGTFKPDITKTLTIEHDDPADPETFTFIIRASARNDDPGASLAPGEQETITITLPDSSTARADKQVVGEKSFDEITFTKAGTYRFQITEVNNNKPDSDTAGFTYDGHVWTIEVTVTDVDSELQVETKYTKWESTSAGVKSETADEIDFENNYRANPVGYYPQVEKLLTGSKVTNTPEIFNFELEYLGVNGASGAASEDGVNLPANMTASVEGSDKTNFGEIGFTKPGEYKFRIKETAGSTSGYTYDSSAWILTVTVTNVNGYLKETHSYQKEGTADTNPDNAVFVNNYEVKTVSYAIPVQKILEGTVPEGYEQKFHFELELKNADPEDGVEPLTNTSLEIDYSDESARSKTFDAVTFKEAGTYTFEIREVKDGKDGYTYSSDVYTVQIEVKDEDSQLTITLPTSIQYHLGSEVKEKAVFENTYHPLPTEYAPIVTKKIDGMPVNDHEFTFTLEPDSENPAIGYQMPKENELKLTVPAGKDPTISGNFQEIQFTEEGTYNFIIKETKQEDSTYQYDDSEWTLTVEVTDIGGQLEAKTSYSKAGEPAEGTETGTVADTAEFENIYTPQKVTFAPKAVKEIIGAEPSSDSTFSFTLSEQSGNPAGGAELPSPAAASVIGEGSAEFEDITFAKAGTYHFTIQEVNGGVKGYEYDDEPWTLTVVVADKDAVLIVESVSYTRGEDSSTNRALFTNEYSVTPVTFTAEVEKQITGDVPEGEDKNFYFAISTTADTDSVEIADPQIQIIGPGNASFEPITFKVKGEYTFEIREMNTEFTPENQDHGYGYDGTVWTLKVTVSDVGGALQVESATYQLKDGTTGTLALFDNSYTPDIVKYQPVVSDTITGDETPNEKAFTFTVTADSGNPENAELSNLVPASVSIGTKEQQAHSAVGRFWDITFNKAGTYSFEIRQDNDGAPGYTYDGHVWTVTVEVVDIDGVLTVQSVTYTRDDGVTADSAAFENAYAVTETTAVLNVTKQLVVDASSILPNTDETFEFELSVTANPKNGAIVPDNKVITITPDSAHLQGTASYDAITFTKAGTYRFQITEKNHHLAGYTYSGRIWNVTVVVTDEASVLTADITYRDRRGDTSKDTATFVNRFEADPVGYTPWARKVVEGAEMPENHEAEFTFALEKIEGADSGVIMPDNRTASVIGVGRADFEEITFDQAGTYKFRITEETGEAHGYDYDAASWILTVEVTNVDGKLKVDPVYEPETGTAESSTVEATFTNHYSVISTRLVPSVTKTVTGNPVPKGMEKNFAFSLKPTGLEPADGCTANKQPVTLDTVLSTNRTGDGRADFPAVTFTKAGTYTFEIWENVPTAVPTGYTYDTTVWTLTVEVVDDDHRLRAYAAYQSPLVNKSSSADFVNRYVPDAASFVPAVEKTIEGDYVGEKPFTFKIEPEGSTDGVIWPADYQDTVIINGENTGTFGEIGFTKAGEYTFNITEDKGHTKGYSYDESVWTLTVTVTDTDGVLTASGVYEQTKNGIADETVTAPEKNADAAKFVNIYKTEEVRYAPVVSKKVTGDSRPPKPETFRFTIEAAADNPEGAAITDKDLAITTDSSAYEASGTIRSFKEIAFTKAGTYRFTIRETKETAAGYTYDGKTWIVEIEVEDRDSVLTVIRHTYTCEDGTSNDNRAVFTNEYTVKETQYTAKVSKTVEGNPPVDNTFKFYLRAYEDNPEGAVLNDAGELDTEVTGSGTSLFDAITFTKAGVYRFMVGEETGEAQGYDYAGDIWTLTVTVEDQDSQLVVVKTEYSHDEITADEAAFTNVYQAIPRTYVPHVHNIVTGHDRPKGQEFAFTITPDEDYGDRVVMPADGEDTVHITDTGWAEFGGITFTEHGTYTFTITEEVPTELPTGYVYEQHREWTLTVEVTDTDSVLGLKVTYSCKTCQDQGEETGHPMNHREAIFIHSYVPLDTKYAPTVSKAVDGETPEDKTFSFVINSIDEYVDEMQMPDVTTVQVTGSGDAEFDPVIFRKAGVYQFEIREKDDGLTGYYYDINVWILTVTVEDVDGELQVTGKDYVMAGSEDASETAAFINVYRPLSVGYTPKLEKTVVGDTPEVPEVFTFYVTPDESCILDVIWPDDMMIDITGPGTGEFGEFRFTKPGVYTMRLEELIGTAEGYTYDESVWILTVTVTDADGQLEAEAVYTKEDVRAGGEDHALFVNTYKKPEEPTEPEEPTVTENPGTQGTTAAPSQDAAKDADVVTEDPAVSGESKNQSAKTGDEMNLALWMILAGISAAGAGVIYRRKKKKQ